MNREAEGLRKDPDRVPTRSEIEARKRSEARSKADRTSDSADIPKYIGVPLEERLRRKLEAFLRDHPDAMPEGEGLAMLSDLNRYGERHDAGRSATRAKATATS